jgi:hypothetical protein
VPMTHDEAVALATRLREEPHRLMATVNSDRLGYFVEAKGFAFSEETYIFRGEAIWEAFVREVGARGTYRPPVTQLGRDTATHRYRVGGGDRAKQDVIRNRPRFDKKGGGG